MIDNLIDLGFMLCILFAAFGVAAVISGILQHFFNVVDKIEGRFWGER